MPKCSLRRPERRRCGGSCGVLVLAPAPVVTLPTAKISPRKISFEESFSPSTSEGTFFPAIASRGELDEDENDVLPSPSTTKRLRRAGRLDSQKSTSTLRRPTPSVCLASLADEEPVLTRTSSSLSGCRKQEDANSTSTPAWGHFVDVIPPDTDHDLALSPGPKGGGSAQSTYMFAPYTIRRPSSQPSSRNPNQQLRQFCRYSRPYRRTGSKSRITSQKREDLLGIPSAHEGGTLCTADIEEALERMFM